MKVKYFLMMLASSFLLSNCSQDEEATQVIQGKTNKLIATIEGASRSAVTDSGIFSWTEGDAISVWNGTDFTTFTLSDGNVFTAQESINPSGVAIYPANVAHTYENQTAGVELAAEYAYGSTNAPLLAQVSGTNLTFKHLGGLMKFVVKGMPERATSFTFTANAGITGNFEVNEGVIAASTATDDNKSVTINFTENQYYAESMTFYIPLPTGTYTGYTVSIGEGEKMTNVSGNDIVNTINRGTLLLMPTFTYDATNGLTKGTNDVIVLESREQSLSVSGDKSLVIEAEDDVQAVLNLNYTPTDNAELTLSESSEATGSQEQSLATINVAVPNASTVSSLDINLPSMTVELTAKDGESATYSQVTTLTAQNTLKIGKGVNVGKLIVKGGHIRLSGAITGEITRDSANGDAVTYIILEEGAEAPANLPANVKVVNAAEYDLIKAIEMGGTQSITLTNDVKLTHPLTLNNADANITIDLGTYSLTNQTSYDYDACGKTECYVFEVQAGTLNIIGTTGSVNAIGGSDYDMAIFANQDGKVNISGGKFTNLGQENDGCDLIYARDNAVVTISGGEFEAGNKSSDVGNQYVALNLKDKSNATITVTGGKFHKFNPAYNVSENPKKNFVSEGYVSKEEDNEIFVVVAKS